MPGYCPRGAFSQESRRVSGTPTSPPKAEQGSRTKADDDTPRRSPFRNVAERHLVVCLPLDHEPFLARRTQPVCRPRQRVFRVLAVTSITSSEEVWASKGTMHASFFGHRTLNRPPRQAHRPRPNLSSVKADWSNHYGHHSGAITRAKRGRRTSAGLGDPEPAEVRGDAPPRALRWAASREQALQLFEEIAGLQQETAHYRDAVAELRRVLVALDVENRGGCLPGK